MPCSIHATDSLVPGWRRGGVECEGLSVGQQSQRCCSLVWSEKPFLCDQYYMQFFNLRRKFDDGGLSLIMYYISTRSWRLCRGSWNRPFSKGGRKDRQEPGSYRPISLTSCVARTMEKIVNAKIPQWGYAGDVFADDSVFLVSSSCRSCALRVEH